MTPHPLLTISVGENGRINIHRYPFHTVFEKEEWKEIEEYCASHSSRPHTPAAPLKNLEAYTKGRSDVLDEILSKTIGDQHTYLMTQHDTTIRNQTLMPIIEKMINDRSLCEEMEVKTSGASGTYYGSRAACLEHYIEFIESLRHQSTEARK